MYNVRVFVYVRVYVSTRICVYTCVSRSLERTNDVKVFSLGGVV